jgi:hypothetical protein
MKIGLIFIKLISNASFYFEPVSKFSLTLSWRQALWKLCEVFRAPHSSHWRFRRRWASLWSDTRKEIYGSLNWTFIRELYKFKMRSDQARFAQFKGVRLYRCDPECVTLEEYVPWAYLRYRNVRSSINLFTDWIFILNKPKNKN